MPENRQSNYDQVIENWRLKFLEMDQEELIRKFQLEADEEFLYIIYFSKRFRIDRKNGFITEDGKSPGIRFTIQQLILWHRAIWWLFAR